MKSLKIAFTCVCAAIAAAQGGLIVDDVLSYGKALTSSSLNTIILLQLLFGLLVYAVVGLAYLAVRYFIKKRNNPVV